MFEFGCGDGKHLRWLRSNGIETFGLDISIVNVFRAQAQDHGYALGDERYLKFLGNFDCVLTVSVLDHIELIDEIIVQFKRIAKKVIYLLETCDTPADFYYPHDYESYGFTKLPYKWKSNGDGATYYIWKLCAE